MAEHARFGKQIEYRVISLMLKDGLDVFLPTVDDNGIDAVVRKPDGKYAEIQIKAKNPDGLFANIKHEFRENYWFVFYSEAFGKFFIMSSKEFLNEASQNTKGEHVGTWSINFTEKSTRFQNYLADDFSRIKNENSNKGRENANL